MGFSDNHLATHFARMGARVRVRESGAGEAGGGVRLDVGRDRAGEFFAIEVAAEAEVRVLDVRPSERHLLLLVRGAGLKAKYLCGHDERHWFVAAVPEAAPVGTVPAAREALKPEAVLAAQDRAAVPPSRRQRRRNAAFVRQGEWFFVPDPGARIDESHALRDEPLRRGGGKPHVVEFCYRRGGVTVFVCGRFPNGLTPAEHAALLANAPRARHWGWQEMRRDMEVYARGRVRHADHATITLRGWHRVFMNTETRAAAMRHVAFLD